MSNIAIDVRMISASGIGTYLQSILPKIIDILSHHIFYLLGPSDLFQLAPLLNKKNSQIIPFTHPIYSISEQVGFIKKIPKNTDLFWSPHFNIPLFPNSKLLVTVHDLIPLVLPEFTQSFLKHLYAKIFFNRISEKATGTIFISNFTKSEFESKLSMPKQFKVIYHGVDQFWSPTQDKTMPHTPSPYFLFVGNFKPHKNLQILIEAFRIIFKKTSHRLILVGQVDNFRTGINIENLIPKEIRSRIIITGRVSRESLREYYRNATCLIFPSLYEGFGFPILEALASSCKVIASNIPVFREVGEDNLVYFEPNNATDLAKKMLRIVSVDDNQKTEYSDLLKKYSWEKSAQETASFIEKIVS